MNVFFPSSAFLSPSLHSQVMSLVERKETEKRRHSLQYIVVGQIASTAKAQLTA